MSKIVFIGDSITKGTSYGGVTTTDTFAYKIGVANGYAPADIINKGVNSDTSAGVLARLGTDVIALAPDVCVLMVGVNDWWTNVTLPAYTANMTAIVTQVKAAGIKLVIMSSSVQRGPTADFFSYKKYLQSVEGLAAQNSAPYVDLYREMCAASLYLDGTAFLALYADVVHLSIAGHQFAADLAARAQFATVFSAIPSISQIQKIQDLSIATADYLLNLQNPESLAAIASARAALL